MSRTRLRSSAEAATDSARTRSGISKNLTPKVYRSPMGPTFKRRVTRSCTKSQLLTAAAQVESPSPPSTVAAAVTPTKKITGDTVVEKEAAAPDNCATPKAEKFRIPEINTCPPAPKKRRVLDYSTKAAVRRRPIAFFQPPDVEMFFLAALRDIPAA